MKYIQLGITLNDDLAIKSVIIQHNDTGLEDDYKLLKLVSIALLKSVILNEEDLELKDILKECGIALTKQDNE